MNEAFSCGVYAGRPLSCAVFPLSFLEDDNPQERAVLEREYPCMVSVQIGQTQARVAANARDFMVRMAREFNRFFPPGKFSLSVQPEYFYPLRYIVELFDLAESRVRLFDPRLQSRQARRFTTAQQKVNTIFRQGFLPEECTVNNLHQLLAPLAFFAWREVVGEILAEIEAHHLPEFEASISETDELIRRLA